MKLFERIKSFIDRSKEKELSANLEVSSVVSALNAKLLELRSQSEIISKHSKALQRCLAELETIELPPDVSTKIKAWMERANLIRIASVGMVSVSIHKFRTIYINCFPGK